ncbi:hypothetical protein CB1_001149005 [Camelus ferus]|nr:hypothetical protein CB1_001149005 [Camelus ferus]
MIHRDLRRNHSRLAKCKIRSRRRNQAEETGEPTFPVTRPHQVPSFSSAYLGLFLGTSPKTWILEEEVQTLVERPRRCKQPPRLLRVWMSRSSNAPGLPVTKGERSKYAAHALVLLCPANQPDYSGLLPAR